MTCCYLCRLTPPATQGCSAISVSFSRSVSYKKPFPSLLPVSILVPLLQPCWYNPFVGLWRELAGGTASGEAQGTLEKFLIRVSSFTAGCDSGRSCCLEGRLRIPQAPADTAHESTLTTQGKNKPHDGQLSSEEKI